MSGAAEIAVRHPLAAGAEALDMARIRADFPVLQQHVKGKPLVYLDNASTSQKPAIVIEAVRQLYEKYNANVHRGVHDLSERATTAHDQARASVQRFINARDANEIVFVQGTTEAINLVAQTFGRMRLGPGDEVIVTHMEHHSNIVPWQLLCEQTGARVVVAPVDDKGQLLFEEYLRLLGPRTRLVAAVHVSNALGTINPVAEMVQAAHSQGVPVLLDGAQAVSHMSVDVQALDCDFYAFSGHKVFGPTGIGVLYGKLELLETMPPYQGGGDMIETVSFSGSTYAPPPQRFEAGTPNIAGAIGLGAALDYVSGIGLESIAAHEKAVLEYATAVAADIPGLRIVGTAARKAGILSFVLDGAHPSDVGTILDMQGVAIRAGHHCAMPVLERLGVGATARASFAFYNTTEEVDALVQGIHKVRELCG